MPDEGQGVRSTDRETQTISPQRRRSGAAGRGIENGGQLSHRRFPFERQSLPQRHLLSVVVLRCAGLPAAPLAPLDFSSDGFP
jgi:hypothetical protein